MLNHQAGACFLHQGVDIAHFMVKDHFIALRQPQGGAFFRLQLIVVIIGMVCN